MRFKKITLLICRIVVASVFLGAAIPKILHPHDFAVAVFRYQLAPYWSVNIGAVYMPWLELIVGLALLFVKKLRPAAAVIIFGMLAFFAVAITINIFRGIDIACGCFSVNPHAGTIGWLNVIRNVTLMAMTFAVFRGDWQSPTACDN